MGFKMTVAAAPLRAKSEQLVREIREEIVPQLRKLEFGRQSLKIEVPDPEDGVDAVQFRGLLKRAVAQDGYDIGTEIIDDGNRVAIWVKDFDPELALAKKPRTKAEG